MSDDAPPPRNPFAVGELIVGEGETGGKAEGLVSLSILLREFGDRFPFGIDVDVPPYVVLSTSCYDRLLADNGLPGRIDDDTADGAIARRFQAATLPDDAEQAIEDVARTGRPLAVRSSSLLEDSALCSFAGVYLTKLLPNDEPELGDRISALRNAVLLVIASGFFREARQYLTASGFDEHDEKMAVLIQELVAREHGDRLYPDVSGVARSYNFYPLGGAEPDDGVVELALGLGKTIVEGGATWTFAPARPTAPPPFSNPNHLLDGTQRAFWCVRRGAPARSTPTLEDERLELADISVAERDAVLARLASTYSARSDRLDPGTARSGPRALTFAPLLRDKRHPFVPAIREVLRCATERAGAPVDIEFAMLLPDDGSPPRLSLLQISPMAVGHEEVHLRDEEFGRDDVLVASHRALGHGTRDDVRDVVYVKPSAFHPQRTPVIAREIASITARLADEGRPYVLIGQGRWGSSDTWRGIPIRWTHIRGVAVLVETPILGMGVEPSQGSHFFHNLCSFGVKYFAVRDSETDELRWSWLDAHEAATETDHVRHVQLQAGLLVKADGRRRRGGIWTMRGAH